MSKKPDRYTAMSNIINLVRADFPFYAPESQICGDTRVGRPKNCSNWLKQNLLSGNINKAKAKFKISENRRVSKAL